MQHAEAYVEAIRKSGFSIYDPIEVGAPTLWIPSPELEYLLNNRLKGISLAGLPLRTRSKIVKEHVCKALGYPVPASFKKTQPRFSGQFFDTYIQKSNNLQVWNEELSPTRRYVIIRVSPEDMIVRVRVITGDSLSLLDTTGTLTQKFQARLVPGDKDAELIAEQDTALLTPHVHESVGLAHKANPTDHPDGRTLLSIKSVYKKLHSLVGAGFPDAGIDQERNRGAALHRLVCEKLGYSSYQDDGQFPDVRNQLLEVKLQTSPTIDLGLVCPDCTDALDVPQIGGAQIRHCDVRYALFYAVIENGTVRITHFYLTTGERFFTRFPKFGGKVLNKKLQIPLPSNFFDGQSES